MTPSAKRIFAITQHQREQHRYAVHNICFLLCAPPPLRKLPRDDVLRASRAPRFPRPSENGERPIYLLIAADGVSCRAWAIKCPRRRKAPFAPEPRDKFFTHGGDRIPRCPGDWAGALSWQRTTGFLAPREGSAIEIGMVGYGDPIIIFMARNGLGSPLPSPLHPVASNAVSTFPIEGAIMTYWSPKRQAKSGSGRLSSASSKMPEQNQRFFAGSE